MENQDKRITSYFTDAVSAYDRENPLWRDMIYILLILAGALFLVVWMVGGRDTVIDWVSVILNMMLDVGIIMTTYRIFRSYTPVEAELVFLEDSFLIVRKRRPYSIGSTIRFRLETYEIKYKNVEELSHSLTSDRFTIKCTYDVEYRAYDKVGSELQEGIVLKDEKGKRGKILLNMKYSKSSGEIIKDFLKHTPIKIKGFCRS